MSDTSAQTRKTAASSTGAAGPSSSKGSGLVTEQGRTSIADGVVAKIASIAASEVSGVYALGGGAARAMGAVREAIGAKSSAQGVTVEVGERQAAADVDVVVEYGTSIVDVANGVRQNVMTSITRMTGLEVTEVNVNVVDINIPGQEPASSEAETPRVQ